MPAYHIASQSWAITVSGAQHFEEGQDRRKGRRTPSETLCRRE